ncbi:hypothetical protein EJB05_22865, partial [Eragrostis curvula]
MLTFARHGFHHQQPCYITPALAFRQDQRALKKTRHPENWVGPENFIVSDSSRVWVRALSPKPQAPLVLIPFLLEQSSPVLSPLHSDSPPAAAGLARSSGSTSSTSSSARPLLPAATSSRSTLPLRTPTPHLVLDLCVGGDLFFLVSVRAPLPEPEAADFLAHLADALAGCHNHGVVYHKFIVLAQICL